MRSVRVGAGIVVAALVAALLLLLIRPSDSPNRGEAPPAAAESSEPAPAAEPAAPAARPMGENRVAAGRTLVLESASFQPGQPVALHLVLGEPSRTAEARPIRVIGPQGRVLQAEGMLGEGRMEARLELDPAWLSPGSYLVEVKTTELSHFPVRRYLLEVR